MMTLRNLARLTATLLVGLALMPLSARAGENDYTWYTVDAQKKVRVNLYVFYRDTCPHCQDALAFLARLHQKHPWLDIACYEVNRDANNLAHYRRMSESLNRQAGPVPGFFYCKQMEIGFESEAVTGQRLERALVRCYEAICKHQGVQPKQSAAPLLAPGLATVLLLQPALPEPALPEPGVPLDLPADAFAEKNTVPLPWWGEVDAAEVSLLALTVVLGLCDSINPCAFFVLLFLLSLMIHARSRTKMAIVGATFVFFSGLVYFLFMAAWLNLFYLMGHLTMITVTAGAVAVVVAVINIKDFFWFHQGVSLSIPEDVKPGLFKRMTNLLHTSGLAPVLFGSAVLAATANLYELLCTAGFPMIYTRVLSLRDLPIASHYSWLVLYNLIYVAPLAVIVGVFTLTLGSRKLSEYEGRVLKLLSGVMMLLLGVALLVVPQILTSILGAVGLLAGAVVVTVVVVLLERRLHSGDVVPTVRKTSPPVEQHELVGR